MLRGQKRAVLKVLVLHTGVAFLVACGNRPPSLRRGRCNRAAVCNCIRCILSVSPCAQLIFGIGSDYYPETMWKIYLVNAPMIFRGALRPGRGVASPIKSGDTARAMTRQDCVWGCRDLGNGQAMAAPHHCQQDPDSGQALVLRPAPLARTLPRAPQHQLPRAPKHQHPSAAVHAAQGAELWRRACRSNKEAMAQMTKDHIPISAIPDWLGVRPPSREDASRPPAACVPAATFSHNRGGPAPSWKGGYVSETCPPETCPDTFQVSEVSAACRGGQQGKSHLRVHPKLDLPDAAGPGTNPPPVRLQRCVRARVDWSERWFACSPSRSLARPEAGPGPSGGANRQLRRPTPASKLTGLHVAGGSPHDGCCWRALRSRPRKATVPPPAGRWRQPAGKSPPLPAAQRRWEGRSRGWVPRLAVGAA